uniref:X-Cruf-1 n=1 Tax=Cylindrophis ruffus TaxID=186578 RepID=U3L0L2_CYLRU|nr:X-Cruf-1 [Cylindrophis ruffus]
MLLLNVYFYLFQSLLVLLKLQGQSQPFCRFHLFCNCTGKLEERQKC